ncbi:hypothetical protein UM723_03730 [Staphylococcus aureus]|nr:hypothetical protein UM723_03730 [Staphylococcus aureus]WRN88972.1 hypothetical protein T8986_12460 [Staphylococcus aureus]
MSYTLFEIGPFALDSFGWKETIPPKKDGDSEKWLEWLALLLLMQDFLIQLLVLKS